MKHVQGVEVELQDLLTSVLDGVVWLNSHTGPLFSVPVEQEAGSQTKSGHSEEQKFLHLL
jgi:hypothetical protein